MNRSEILSFVVEQVENLCNRSCEGKVTEKTSLENDADLDSLDFVEIIMRCEKEFNISIPDDHAINFKTVGELVDFIEKEISKYNK